MVPVNRGAGPQALVEMTERARTELAARPPAHHLSRRARGGRPAPSRATNTASRISTRRRACRACRSRSIPACSGRAARSCAQPGTVVVEMLDPIAPGLDKERSSTRLQDAIETGDRAADRGGATTRQLPAQTRRLVRALELRSASRCRSHVAIALRLEFLDRRQHVVAVVAGAAVALPHEMQLLLRGSAARHIAGGRGRRRSRARARSVAGRRRARPCARPRDRPTSPVRAPRR